MAERESLLLPPSPTRPSVDRIRYVVSLWVGFGIVAGVLTAPQGGAVGLASGVLAGLIVLCPFGAVLGLLGAQVKLSLVGGVAGSALAALTALLLSRGVLAYMACVGLIAGGVAGATCSAVVGWLRFLMALGTTPGRTP